MNKVELMGRLTADVELVKTKTDMDMGRFTLAVPRKTKKGEKEITDFIDCIVFGNLAKILKEYVVKGNRIIVCGSINTNTYEDKDGNKKKSVYILVDDFYFTEYRKEKDEQLEIPNM